MAERSIDSTFRDLRLEIRESGWGCGDVLADAVQSGWPRI